MALSFVSWLSLCSCVGRCGEVFTRGQQCTCDFGCLQHNECCPDFQATCTTTPSCQGRCGETFRRGRTCECDPQCVQFNTCCQDFQLHCGQNHLSPNFFWTCASQNSSNPLNILTILSPQTSLYNIPVGLLPRQVSTSPGGAHHFPAGQLSQPNNDAPVLDGRLCSEAPINGLTALSNGTTLIFKGELFWAVDSIRGSIGPPQNITETLGVPSPIDTVFTRINCNRNTYIIKGDQCWRLDENLVMEPGYPKPLSSEFPGLTGRISAALVVPASRSTPETVFFFKTGDVMQRFTFLPGSTASCGDKPRSSMQKNVAQQADVLLSGEINIKVSLTGFPTPVTSALSTPVPQSTNQYQHFVFSGPPATLTPLPIPILSPLLSATNPAVQNQNPSHPANSIRFWLRCP
uniref:Proteoglycan 4a n=1 Tax=Fundulus heteroclitus TaxID=8078 RepID=A0A3Q2NP16_FUNHE